MPSIPIQPEAQPNGLSLLRQAVELLRWELSTLSNRAWENLPELKKKKVILASLLRASDATPGPTPQERTDSLRLKSQISGLQAQSQQQIERQIALIGHQILALQDIHQYCLECLNITLLKDPPLHSAGWPAPL